MARMDLFVCMSVLALHSLTELETEVQRAAAFDAGEQRNMVATISEHIQARGAPRENCATVGEGLSTAFEQAHDDVRFVTFTFSDGDFRFEGPAIWWQLTDPKDPALKALFLGPVDRTQNTVVLLGVSRYPGKSEAMVQEIERLDTDKGTQILMHEICALDQRPAHILTVRSRAAAPMWESAPTLCERVVIVQDGPDLYVLQYASTPEFYEEYHPVFQRLVASFRFHSDESE